MGSRQHPDSYFYSSLPAAAPSPHPPVSSAEYYNYHGTAAATASSRQSNAPSSVREPSYTAQLPTSSASAYSSAHATTTYQVLPGSSPAHESHGYGGNGPGSHVTSPFQMQSAPPADSSLPPVGARPVVVSPLGLSAMSILSPAPQSPAVTGTTSVDREKDGGLSIAKTSETRGSRLAPSDSWFRTPSKRAGGLILTVVIEAIVVIVLAGIVFGRITSDISNEVQDIKTVPVYLAIFVFGMVFQVAITLDAIRLKNTIQVIGVCIFNVALTVAAALEIPQVHDALASQDRLRGGIPCPGNEFRTCRAEVSLYPDVQRLLIGVTVVCGVAEVPILFWTAKLWTEFGWIIYQKIGANLRIRNMFLWYQTFIVLLKFTFFFGVGFTTFYLILVADTSDWAYGVTIAAVPIAVVVLIVAAFAVRRENFILMGLSLVLMVAGLVYFVYKLTQVWLPSTREDYRFVRLTITFISAFAIFSLACTLANGIVCLLNFRQGLKQAHDSIGRFGGVRRRRARESSTQALDLDRHLEVGAQTSPRPNQSQPRPYANGGAAAVPSYAAPSSSAVTSNSVGMVLQQNATRISLD